MGSPMEVPDEDALTASEMQQLGQVTTGDPTLADHARVINAEYEASIAESRLGNQHHAAALKHAIRCGEELTAAQRSIPAAWHSWVQAHTVVHFATAARYMRLAKYQAELPETVSSVADATRWLNMRGMYRPGRRAGYAPELREQAVVMRAQGLSLRAIADELGVANRTVHRWVDPEIDREDGERARRYKQRQREAVVALQREETRRLARRVGGPLGKAWADTQKLQQTIAAARDAHPAHAAELHAAWHRAERLHQQLNAVLAQADDE